MESMSTATISSIFLGVDSATTAKIHRVVELALRDNEDYESIMENLRSNLGVTRLVDIAEKYIDAIMEAKNKEGKEQGADGKACWKGYKYAGTVNGKDKCVKSEAKEVEKEKEEKGEKKHKETKKEEQKEGMDPEEAKKSLRRQEIKKKIIEDKYEKGKEPGDMPKKRKFTVKHDCATHAEHSEWGSGTMLKEMHTLDEEGNITHYDVMFEHGIEKNVAVEELTITMSEKHEHFINYDKNSEVLDEKKKLDPVGKEDDDVDNDGDSDKSDEYLKKRRATVSAAIKAKKESFSFSDWRSQITEKKNSMVEINPKIEDPENDKPGSRKKMPKVNNEEVEQLDEVTPPGAKYERMVKHIKAGYKKGGLTDKEKSIAYATAWKAKNKEKSEK